MKRYFMKPFRRCNFMVWRFSWYLSYLVNKIQTIFERPILSFLKCEIVLWSRTATCIANDIHPKKKGRSIWPWEMPAIICVNPKFRDELRAGASKPPAHCPGPCNSHIGRGGSIDMLYRWVEAPSPFSHRPNRRAGQDIQLLPNHQKICCVRPIDF